MRTLMGQPIHAASTRALVENSAACVRSVSDRRTDGAAPDMAQPTSSLSSPSPAENTQCHGSVPAGQWTQNTGYRPTSRTSSGRSYRRPTRRRGVRRCPGPALGAVDRHTRPGGVAGPTEAPSLRGIGSDPRPGAHVTSGQASGSLPASPAPSCARSLHPPTRPCPRPRGSSDRHRGRSRSWRSRLGSRP